MNQALAAADRAYLRAWCEAHGAFAAEDDLRAAMAVFNEKVAAAHAIWQRAIRSALAPPEDPF